MRSPSNQEITVAAVESVVKELERGRWWSAMGSIITEGSEPGN